MLPLFDTVAFVFALIALGWATGATRYLPEATGEGLAGFAVGVALPLLLFRTMAQADFSGAAPWALWAAYFSAVAAAWTMGHLLTTRLFGGASQMGVVGGVSSAFSNLLLIGIPLVQGVFGQAGFEALSLILAVHLPVMLLASVLLFQLFGPRGDGSIRLGAAVRQFLSKVFANPLIIGILLGLLWRAGGLDMPGLMRRLVEALSGVASPLALFAVGLNLSRFGLSGQLGPAVALSALKLFVMPAAALLAAWALGLPPLAAKVAVLAAALPAGVNTYLIATQFGTGQGIASNVMTVATASAILTISLWLWVLQGLYG
ncbi:MAG TPA: AEC family transporter [Mesorhizobium sp.]|jgi:hypothetical protein|nr:AEC family transporter [Mesorhizobium sp.]